MKKSRNTDEKILKSAIQIFVRKGYHGTSIDDITKASGLTKGALYAHFSSKADLLEKILGKFREDFLDELIKAVNEYEGDPLLKLNYVISFNAEYATHNLDLLVFLNFLSHELSTNIEFEFGLKKLYREYQQFISGLLKKGINQGLIKSSFDPEMLALTFMGIHDGVLHHWVLNRHILDGRLYVKTLRQVFMEGIKT